MSHHSPTDHAVHSGASDRWALPFFMIWTGQAMSLLGSNGIRQLARDNMENARKLCSVLSDLPGVVAPWFKGHYFNEFVVVMPNPSYIHKSLLNHGIIGGKLLERQPGLEGGTLYTATEMITESDIERLKGAMKDVLGGEP